MVYLHGIYRVNGPLALERKRSKNLKKTLHYKTEQAYRLRATGHIMLHPTMDGLYDPKKEKKG